MSEICHTGDVWRSRSFRTRATRRIMMSEPDWAAAERSTVVTVRFVSGHLITPGASTTFTQVHELADRPANLQHVQHAHFALFGLPVSVFRDPDYVGRLIEPNRALIAERTGASWAIALTFVARDDDFRHATPSLDLPQDVVGWVQFGPYDPSELANAGSILQQCVALIWVVHQGSYLLERAFRQTYATTIWEARDRYLERLAAKDGLDAQLRQERGSRLLGRAYDIAYAALTRGDAETAAQYSRPIAIRVRNSRGIQFSPEPGHGVGRLPFLRDFGQLANRWTEIEAELNAVQQGFGTVCSEGFAEWSSMTGIRLCLAGDIRPLVPFDLANPGWARPLPSLNLSPSNPYRRGLELMMRVEQAIGPEMSQLTSVVASAPSNTLSTWLTLPHFRQIPPSSPWTADRRLELLADMDPVHHPSIEMLDTVLDRISQTVDVEPEGVIAYAEHCYAAETP
jgi:hypothetical protein